MLTKLLMRFDPEQYRVHESAAGLAAPFEHEHDTSTSTIDQGSKAVLGKSSQENKILTDCSTVDTEGRNRMAFKRELLVWVSCSYAP